MASILPLPANIITPAAIQDKRQVTRSLYVEGPAGSGKTSRLIAELCRMLTEMPDRSSSFLVLCSNHSRQISFQKRLFALFSSFPMENPMERLSIYTYAGFIRTLLFDFWPLAEMKILGQKTDGLEYMAGKPSIMPKLVGLEDSELMLKALYVQLKQQDPQAFTAFSGTERALMKQLIRRFRLRSENRLTRQDMIARSQLLNEICIPEVDKIMREFDRFSYRMRVLDTNKQLDVFHSLLEENSDFQHYLIQTFSHLIVDDLDETIPAQQGFIRFMMPHVRNLILAADIDGGSRRGYLNAYPYDWDVLKAQCPGTVVRLERRDAMAACAQKVLLNWKRKTDFFPLNPLGVKILPMPMTRLEMLEQALRDILVMIRREGYRPGDISLVLPVMDRIFIYSLRNRLEKQKIKLQVLSGTRRPIDDPYCRAFMTLLQLVNRVRWGHPPGAFDWKGLLLCLFQDEKSLFHDQAELDALVHTLSTYCPEADQPLIPAWDRLIRSHVFLNQPDKQAFHKVYLKLTTWLDQVSSQPFEKQLFSAFSNFIAPAGGEEQSFEDIRRLIESYHSAMAVLSGLSAFGKLGAPPEMFDRLWLAQVTHGAVADTPENVTEVDEEAIVLGTPQKIIDYEVRRKVQFWLDSASREWARSDSAPLYNAWVHSAAYSYSKQEYEASGNQEDINETIIHTRAGHITRTLMLYASECIRVYGSELDQYGFSQSGPLPERLAVNALADGGNIPRAQLRSDQADILKYRRGTMAITAVPGAGKTFVNVELILELIEQGIPPESILVLTYMDSAAKTLLQRLKSKLSGIIAKMPLISTLHGLAYRILTEDEHCRALNLTPEEIQLADPVAQEELLQEIAGQTLPEMTASKTISMDDWTKTIRRGISHAKFSQIQMADLENHVRQTPDAYVIKRFLPAYRVYGERMKSIGRLDFDDLILLAVRLLESNPAIRQKYETRFQVIIEDEAQDSSRLLQRLIGLLSGTRGNIIRTGDTNQSITTTYTTADTSVFREFIRQADRVITMDQSNRCAPEIIRLANRWIEETTKLPQLQNAFQPVMMNPAEALHPDFQNPALLYPFETYCSLTFEEELDWLAVKIQTIRLENPRLTIAVLVSSNEQITKVSHKLQKFGFPVISQQDRMQIQPVCKLLSAFLKVLNSPSDTTLQVSLYEAICEMRQIPDAGGMDSSDCDLERRKFLETHALLYIKPSEIYPLTTDPFLIQLYFDCMDFSRHTLGESDIIRLMIRMTERLFPPEKIEARSHGYLCAVFAEELLRQHHFDVLGEDHWAPPINPMEVLVTYLEKMSRTRSGRSGFETDLTAYLHQFVQVMTLHKSKGQEFDVVFMPFLTPYKASSREEDRLIQALDRLIVTEPQKNNSVIQSDPLEIAKLEERARLMYVGVTRAKKGLFISTHLKSSMYEKKNKTPDEPSTAFRILSQLMREIQPDSTHLNNMINLP